MAAPNLTLLGSPTTFPPMPVLWDGDRYEWDDWQQLPPSSYDIHEAAAGHPRSCEGCGAPNLPYTAFGRRQPSPGEVFEIIRGSYTFTARWGTTYTVPRPAHVPAWPIIQLHATRCAWCGHTDVYDMDSFEHWTLDADDYGPTGSNRPTNTIHPAALAAEEN